MLDYKIFDRLGFYGGGYDDSAVAAYVKSELDRRVKYHQDKQGLIYNLQYEDSIIINDICEVIKDDLYRSALNIFRGLTSELASKAWRYFNRKPGDEYTEEQLKEYKSAFDFFVFTVNRRFFNDDKELIDNLKMTWFGYCGYDEHAYSVEYSYKNGLIKLSVEIPMFSNANVQNWAGMLAGYYIRYAESEYSWDIAASGLIPDEVRDKFLAWLPEYEKKVLADREAKKEEPENVDD